jgi:peptide subunit release factor 1 (eRF1)
MITRQQIDQLRQFQNGTYLITSCYLNFDRSQMPLPALKIRAKDLLQSARHQLEARAATHQQRESLQRDFERLEALVVEDVAGARQKALAVFSCAGEQFWQIYRLPRLVRNMLVADPAPYVRPLLAVLGRYERYCVVVADSVRGQMFEVYMGEIVEHPLINGEVPRKVREGGLGGRDERTMERRHDGAVQQHLKQVAGAAFQLFQAQQFDRLVLGGSREVLGGLKAQLHRYLRERWAGDFHAEPGRTSPAEILAATLAIEEQLADKRARELVTELTRRAGTGERAVVGLPATARAVAQREAQTLVVEDGFERAGRVCRSCRHAGVETDTCPQCGQPSEECPDTIDELVGWALATDSAVQYVPSDTPLRDAGRVGALLRY